jgi:YjbE family integral membrane protein
LTQLITLAWVLSLDLALSLDNAAVIALVTDKLPEQQRKHAMWGGIAAAVVLRIVCALFASVLMKVAFLSAFGGVYLMHVAVKLACEKLGIEYSFGTVLEAIGWKLPATDPAQPKTHGVATVKDAIIAIGIADLSMSVDNVLAVAGTAKHHPMIMTIGLTVSVLSMFLAAVGIHKMLEKWPRSVWIAVGLVFVTGCKLVLDAALASA